MSKRKKAGPSSPRMGEGVKRMRQSTLTFGKSDVSDSVKMQDGNKWVWHESRGIMRLETKDWMDKVRKAEESAKFKVAAFDMDHTLIKTKTGVKFPRFPTDFLFWSPRVLPKLRELAKEGCVLAIFSNQASIGQGRLDASFIRTRVEAIVEDMKVPIAVFIATQYDHHRKPSIGMWFDFLDRIGGKDKVDLHQSFFVGDAAGRKGDFSNSDLKFSINADVHFWTPENFFENKQYNPKEFSLDGFDPRELVTMDEYVMESNGKLPDKWQHLRRILSPPEMCDLLMDGQSGSAEDGKPRAQCLVIMFGPPASGKTTFAKRYLVDHGYVWVNKDSLGTNAKCVKALRAGLKSGQSVVVDNTSALKTARARFIQVVKEHDKNLPVYCVKMDTPKELALHLNVVRAAHMNGEVRSLPMVAFNSYFKRAVEPDEEEGFAMISSVKFVPYFRSEDEKCGFTRLS